MTPAPYTALHYWNMANLWAYSTTEIGTDNCWEAYGSFGYIFDPDMSSNFKLATTKCLN